MKQVLPVWNWGYVTQRDTVGHCTEQNETAYYNPHMSASRRPNQRCRESNAYIIQSPTSSYSLARALDKPCRWQPPFKKTSCPYTCSPFVEGLSKTNDQLVVRDQGKICSLPSPSVCKLSSPRRRSMPRCEVFESMVSREIGGVFL